MSKYIAIKYSAINWVIRLLGHWVTRCRRWNIHEAGVAAICQQYHSCDQYHMCVIQLNCTREPTSCRRCFLYDILSMSVPQSLQLLADHPSQLAAPPCVQSQLTKYTRLSASNSHIYLATNWLYYRNILRQANTWNTDKNGRLPQILTKLHKLFNCPVIRQSSANFTTELVNTFTNINSALTDN